MQQLNMASASTEDTIPDEIARHIKTPSLSRHFLGDHSKNKNTLHVLQWNVLAQAFSYTKDNFIRVSNDALDFENRKWRILQQIIAHKPDLCALEEMDIFNVFLKDELPKYGYSCHFVQKIHSKCLLFEDDAKNFKGPDGTLLCFKTDLFIELARHQDQLPDDGRQEKHIFAVLELEHKSSSKKIIFIGTHLKARKTFEASRTAQTEALIQYIKNKYPMHTHMILAGDFNGDNTEPFYQDITKYGFRSAYCDMLNNKEPPYTTWKFKGRDGTERESCRTIDYVFFTPNGFTPKAILQFPTLEAMGPNGLPSINYPSDHLALEVIFNIQ